MNLYGLAGSFVILLIGVWVSYRIGFKRGLNESKLLGVFCDVCEQVKPKLISFRMTIMCEDCYKRIMSNKDLRCQFCKNPIEYCKCSE